MGGTSGGEGDRAEDEPALPLRNRARLAIALLALVVITDLFAIWADLNLLDVVQRVIDGERVGLRELNSADDRTATTGIAQLVVYVITTIAFLLWYSRAYRNVIAMGARPPRYGTRWAVWYWFIPIVNLFRPKQVVNDIWRGSDPDLRFGDSTFPKHPLLPLLAFWWGMWLIANFAGRAATRLAADARTAQDFETQAQVYLAADAVDAIAAVLAAAVVWKITERQEQRRHRFEAGEIAPVQPAGPPAPAAT